MMEYWARSVMFGRKVAPNGLRTSHFMSSRQAQPVRYDVEDKKTKILSNPLFQHSIVPLFQLRSEAELSSNHPAFSLRVDY